MLAARRTARRRVVHQRGPHLRRSQRPERNRGGRGRSVLSADRGSGRRRSARASSRPSSCCRSSRSDWSRVTGRAARSNSNFSSACSPFARIAAKALVLLAGWLIASCAARWRSFSGRVTAAASMRRSSRLSLLGHLLNAGLTVATRRGHRVADRASVDRRDPDARRHGRHLDRQLRRRRSRAASGSAPPATRRRRWWRSSSTDWCGSTSC